LFREGDAGQVPDRIEHSPPNHKPVLPEDEAAIEHARSLAQPSAGKQAQPADTCAPGEID